VVVPFQSWGPDELEAVEVNPDTATDSMPVAEAREETDKSELVGMAKSAVTAVLENNQQVRTV